MLTCKREITKVHMMGTAYPKLLLKYLRDWRHAAPGHVLLITALCEPQQLIT